MARSTVFESISIPIIEESGEPVPTAEAIADGLGEGRVAGELYQRFLEPGFRCFNRRPGFLLSDGTPRIGAAAVDFGFDERASG